MAEQIFGIAGYAACRPPLGDDICWMEGGPVERPPLPTALRRRIGPIGRATLRAAWMLPQVGDARLVFASRHGEFDRTLAMLDRLAAEEAPSPADFSLGVHSALAGLLSVCTGNRRGHVALAAGTDSFGFGLMEAAACLAERPDEPVLLVYYDAPLPPGYADAALLAAEAPLALAVAMAPQTACRVAMAATPLMDVNPSEAAASVFLRFLQQDASEARATGEQMRWCWRRV